MCEVKHMRMTLLVLVVLACVTTYAQDRSRALRVVYLVGGFAHDYDKMPEELARELKASLERNGRTAEVEITKDLAAFDRASLARTDLLLMSTCQQSEVSPARREAFLAAVREGLPIVALHCTFWSFQTWPEFRQVLGAFVPGHAPFGPMCVERTSDAGNLAAGLPSRFELTDEPYYVNERDPAMKVIARSCDVYTDRDGKRRDGVEPSVWTKSFGKGRVFAMTFGHDMQSQGSDSFKRLFNNGVRWALRMD
jgi:type 1 glutamine amidotransferase